MTPTFSEIVRNIDFNLRSKDYKNYKVHDLKEPSHKISINKNEITSIIINYGEMSYKPFPIQVQRMEIHLYVLDKPKIVDNEKSSTQKQNDLKIGENNINLIDKIIRDTLETNNQKFIRSAMNYDSSTHRFTYVYSFDTILC